MKNIIIMFFVFLLSIVSIPSVMIVIGLLDEETLHSIGMQTNPNYKGGIIIAEFTDPENDLLEKLPVTFSGLNYEKALDLRKFSVAKVSFVPFTGQGIASRMNLVFEFDGKLPNPHGFHNKFSLPVLHVFINNPNLSSIPVVLEGIENLSFAGNNCTKKRPL